jgi:hypothetical protein
MISISYRYQFYQSLVQVPVRAKIVSGGVCDDNTGVTTLLIAILCRVQIRYSAFC